MSLYAHHSKLDSKLLCTYVLQFFLSVKLFLLIGANRGIFSPQPGLKLPQKLQRAIWQLNYFNINKI